MTTSRREFLQSVAVAGGAFALPRPERGAPLPRPAAVPAQTTKRILILGGTGFIGPYMVRYARDRGHRVTMFNRGQTRPDLFPNVENLIGDRVDDLSALEGREWDVVIDNSATNPDWVRRSAQLLKDSVGQYVFTSTRSVYSDLSNVPMDVDGPVFTPETTEVPEGRPLPYGLAKALAEKEAHAAFPGRTIILRPGLIIGPGDPTDRFTYWPVRIDRGGEVMAPGDGSDPVQIIDVRDHSEWTVRMAESGTVGTFMSLGPASAMTFEQLLHIMRGCTSAPVSFTWVGADFLIERDVRPYREMPVWMPARGDRSGFAQFDLTRSIEAGLTYRPMAVTVLDTLEFHRSRPPERQAELRAGIAAEREVQVLAAWHAR
jgi:2'-hydroxyisoflavone reductase